MNENLTTYTILHSGNYLIPAPIFHHIPTGKYETIRNPHRKFFEFWEPKYVQVEVFKTEIKYDGVQVMYLEKGQILDIKGPIHRI